MSRGYDSDSEKTWTKYLETSLDDNNEGEETRDSDDC